MLLLKRIEKEVDDLSGKRCYIDTYKVKEIKTKEDAFKFMKMAYDLLKESFDNLEGLEVGFSESKLPDDTKKSEVLNDMISVEEMNDKYCTWDLEVMHIFAYYKGEGVSIIWSVKEEVLTFIFSIEYRYGFMKLEDAIHDESKKILK